VGPGVWLLSRNGAVDPNSLPKTVGRVGLSEYHVNEARSDPDEIVNLTEAQVPATGAVRVHAILASRQLPDEVHLWLRRAGARSFGERVSMERVEGNEYSATLAPGALEPGLYEYLISLRAGAHRVTFPEGGALEPGDWPFLARSPWTLRVVPSGSPLRLLDPGKDFDRLSFVRPGEQYRSAYFRIAPGEAAEEASLRLFLPDLGADTPTRYAAALYVGDAIAARRGEAAGASAVEVRLRAAQGGRRGLDLALVERDGAAWSAHVPATSAWTSVRIPIADFRIGRSIHIPSPYPGLWNYWRESPPGRGAAGDHLQAQEIERIQLTLLPAAGERAGEDARAVDVESVRLLFEPR